MLGDASYCWELSVVADAIPVWEKLWLSTSPGKDYSVFTFSTEIAAVGIQP